MKGVMSHIGTNLPIRGVTCRRYTYLLTVEFLNPSQTISLLILAF